jgi:hypothetical protein
MSRDLYQAIPSPDSIPPTREIAKGALYSYNNVFSVVGGSPQLRMEHFPEVDSDLPLEVRNKLRTQRDYFYEGRDRELVYRTLGSNVIINNVYTGYPIVMRLREGHYADLPSDPNSPTNHHQESDMYMHVYGRLPYIYLDFADDINVEGYKHVAGMEVCSGVQNLENVERFLKTKGVEALKTIFTGRELASAVGGKVVYKRPPQYAASGYRFMYKIYFGGVSYYSVRGLKEALSQCPDSPFKSAIYNSTVNTSTAWLVAAVLLSLWSICDT